MPGRVEGTIAAINVAGDAITDIAVERLSEVPRGESTTVKCGAHHTVGLYPPDHGEPEMTFLALLGASGYLELTLVGDKASEFLGFRPGHKVLVKW